MGIDASVVTFRPRAADDLPLLWAWLDRPHVGEWWGDAPATLTELAAEYAAVLAGAASHHAFLAEAEQLGQGLGTAMVRAFVVRLFADRAVTRVQTDPHPSNRRAIRCHEKAGFRSVGEVDTPDGRALLMYADRPDTGGGLHVPQ
jgi:GNAT superfamily N-acetyltransferase